MIFRSTTNIRRDKNVRVAEATSILAIVFRAPILRGQNLWK
jgi:hypothetical protein